MGSRREGRRRSPLGGVEPCSSPSAARTPRATSSGRWTASPSISGHVPREVNAASPEAGDQVTHPRRYSGGPMSQDRPRSDALVFFGATGDLAYKKIFPALQAMARRGKLDFPVVGVAKSGWTRDQLVERARASVSENGGEDHEAFQKLVAQLRYVDGDYNDQSTFTQVRAQLDGRLRPAHYLAIPPSMFPTVITRLAEANLATNARVIVEKPFGRDLASARDLNRVLSAVLPETSVFR